MNVIVNGLEFVTLLYLLARSFSSNLDLRDIKVVVSSFAHTAKCFLAVTEIDIWVDEYRHYK